jgi:hypothetical protein
MTALQIGDKAKIIGNQSGHRFSGDEIVTITGSPAAEEEVMGYSVKSGSKVGFVQPKDLELVFPPHEETKQARIEIVSAVELDPSKKYLLVFDKRSLSLDDMHRVSLGLVKLKIPAYMAIAVAGKPSEVLTVIEAPPKKKK